MSEEKGFGEDMRRELREALETMRKEIEKAGRDLSTATRTVARSTEKLVQDVSPKVVSTLDETAEKTSAAFRQAMTTIDKQTKTQQVALLKGYKRFLSKQVDMIDKRLKELTK